MPHARSVPAADRPLVEDGGRSRSRRRGVDLEQAILQAAWEELAEVGYENLTMAAVAARAKTSKAVLYRRWPNRAELATAAIDQRIPDLAPDTPNTGTLREDLLVLLSRLARRYQEIQLIPGDAELAVHMHHRASRDVSTQLHEVLRQADERNEIDLPRLSHRVTRLPTDLLHHQLFLTRTPISNHDLTEIIDEIFMPLAARYAAESR